jgi:hypothetical protein
MIDRTTKILLGLIAAGLWLNFASTVVHKASAEVDEYYVRAIRNDLQSIHDGKCRNPKIC